MRVRLLWGLTFAALLAACGRSSPPLAPLADAIMREGVAGIIPSEICSQLGARVCDAPTVKTVVYVTGNQAKFAQVLLKSPENLALGIRTNENASVFLTSASGELLGAMYLSKMSGNRVMNREEAEPSFEREKAFWIQWVPRHLPAAPAEAPATASPPPANSPSADAR